MPRELLRTSTSYIALARSHLEYASAIFMSASKTQLKKLDTIQKVASRVIYRVPRDTHSKPLLAALRLDTLESRRNEHAIQIIEAILDRSTHPALAHMFTLGKDGGIENSNSARIQLGDRRFSSFSKNIYNSARAPPHAPTQPSRSPRSLGANDAPSPSSPLKWIDGHRQPYNILAVNRSLLKTAG